MSEERKSQGPWSEEEPAPDARELEEARDLGERLDRALAGQRLPADERLSTALMVRAAEHDQPLGSDRRAALLAEALADAGRAALPRARRGQGFARVRRWAPALALAASLLLVAGSFLILLSPRREAMQRPALPTALQSRSSDELIGRPFEDRAGASQRLDLVFADRLAGYRRVRFGERSWR